MKRVKERMLSSFLEIAVGQSAHTAKQFLEATSWNLEEAIQLYFVGNETVPCSYYNPPPEDATIMPESEDDVRAPLPVKRETLYDYDDASFYGASNPTSPSNVWEAEEQDMSSSSTGESLASLYRPPFAMMHQGSFESAKQTASAQEKWLIVNLQSTKEFSSHTLNRDTWGNEAVSQTITTNFTFWQVYDDSTEGRKVCTYYKLETFPVVLVIDPITGQKMRSWSGMIDPESLLEDLLPFMDSRPKDHHGVTRPRGSLQNYAQKEQETTEEDEELLLALAASLEDIKDQGGPTFTCSQNEELLKTSSDEKPMYPPLPEEPISKPMYPPLPEEPKVDRSLLCRVGVRLPDGRRLQRNFLRTDPLQLLWSFCRSQLPEEAGGQPFRLTQAIPGATKWLDYESKLTFGESGLANSMISVTWE